MKNYLKKVYPKASGFLKSKAAKIGMVASTVGATAVAFGISASADSTVPDTTTISGALQTGLSSAATQTVGVMAAVVPYGITIFVSMLVVTYAKKFFTKVAGTHG